VALRSAIFSISPHEGAVSLALHLGTVRTGALIGVCWPIWKEDARRRNITRGNTISPAAAPDPRRRIAHPAGDRQPVEPTRSGFTPAGTIEVMARNVTVKNGQSQEFPLPVVAGCRIGNGSSSA